ncbi:uncharacterized protein CC84DRAFT_622256 [Paraphaeosphaeria sporulosa]|uniref:Uncharacterized protein n=1 Tax=Paraphaeosphaeria sporulosa TaxID=1460663 RepID=A0A177CGW4_9PLEO|nr:uncharacterized protein CC84DRAFT_622256 [Paraphaeosphaeria sporulosa]OAG06814.1 hypothetical protein CC84DRAFT_622256 [Paraphaeosphaeria sporulosa]
MTLVGRHPTRRQSAPESRRTWECWRPAWRHIRELRIALPRAKQSMLSCLGGLLGIPASRAAWPTPPGSGPGKLEARRASFNGAPSGAEQEYLVCLQRRRGLPTKRYMLRFHSKHVRRDPNLDRAVSMARRSVSKQPLRCYSALSKATRRRGSALCAFDAVIDRLAQSGACYSVPLQSPYAVAPVQFSPPAWPSRMACLPRTPEARCRSALQCSALPQMGPSPVRGRQASV